MDTCEHIEKADRNTQPNTPEGCEECLETNDIWVSLRMCLTCGHVGCCDSSKNKHTTAHFKSTQHPVVKTLQTKKNWVWCYIDEIMKR